MRIPFRSSIAAGLLVGTLTLPANAAIVSQVGDDDICTIMAIIGRDAAVKRQSGVSQHQAAQEMSAAIGRALSNRRGGGAERQRFASLIGDEATGILRLVYSVPIGRNDGERMQLVVNAEEYIYLYCMGYMN